MEIVCRCHRQKARCGRICPVATNARKSARHNTRPGPQNYGKEWSFTWSSTLKTSRGFFLVNEKRTQHLGTLEGERQRTVKEWCTFMGQPTEYGDNILLQGIVLYLKKPVQVFFRLQYVFNVSNRLARIGSV